MFDGAYFNLQSMSTNVGVGGVSAKAKGEVHVKMGHAYIYGAEKRVKSTEEVSSKGDTLKETAVDNLLECDPECHYFNTSCESVSSEIAQSEARAEDFLEVRRPSIYHNSKSRKKFWPGDLKETKSEGKVDCRSNSKKNKGLDGSNYAQKRVMHDLQELQQEGGDCLLTNESSKKHTNGMAKDKKSETEDLIRYMSKLPDYLQRAEKTDSFQERALRFGVLDWSLLEKWNRKKGGKGPRRSFNSPSGSDTSSSFSTLESSSFSCRSEASYSAKRERSPSSSLLSYLNSASSSSVKPHCRSHSSSPSKGQERYSVCVEGSRHGSKETSLRTQLVTDTESPHNEYFDFNLLEGKMVKNQGSVVGEMPKVISATLEKEVPFSDLKSPECVYSSEKGVGNENEIDGSRTEQGSNPVFELPKEQWVSGCGTPCFLSAGDRSPETCSEMSLNFEDVPQQFGEKPRYSSAIGSNQGDNLEDDVNNQFLDCFDELPSSNVDGSSIQTYDPPLIDKLAESLHNLSLQKAASGHSPSSESDQNHIFLEGNSISSGDTQNCVLPKSPICSVNSKLSYAPETTFHLRTGSTDESLHNLSLQKAGSDHCPTSESDQNHIFLDGNSIVSRGIQKSIPPKNPTCSVNSKVSYAPETAFHLRTASTDVLFHRSQSAVYNELQNQYNVSDIPVKSAEACSNQHLHETVVRDKSPIGIRTTHTNRRAKSFSVSGTRDPAINNCDTVFMTPKSFSVKPDGCHCHGNLSKAGCKVHKKASISPLRRWIDPVVKSKERHRMDVSTSARLEHTSLHHGQVHGVSKSKASVTMEISPSKSDAQGFPRYSHKTSKNSSARLASSENQSLMASEGNVLGKNFLSVSRSRCNSPGRKVKNEQFSEKLSEVTLDTDVARSSTQTPPAHRPILQGLLHFVYKSGLPYFTFSLNGSEEVLAAKTWKTDKSEAGDFDWMYSFHSGQSNNKKKNKTGWVNWGRKDNHVPDIVGKMKVSSSLCSKLNSFGNIEHMVETDFVLFGVKKENTSEIPTMQMEHTEKDNLCPSQLVHSGNFSSNVSLQDSFPDSTTSSSSMSGDVGEILIPRGSMPPKPTHRKKEMNVLRYPFSQSFNESCQSSSMRSRSTSRNTTQVKLREPDVLDSDMCISSSFCPHLELAALVIKVPLEWRESVKGGPGEDTVSNKFAGWGLKFLDKSGGTRSETILDYSITFPPSELNDDTHFHSFKSSATSMDCSDFPIMDSIRSLERCSFVNEYLESSDTSLSCGAQGHTSVTVLIPAGIHGSPITESDGPSPLIERWQTGGRCDCGGWDLGCSLTIIDNSNPNKSGLPESNIEMEGFHPSDLYIQGAKESTPALSLAIVNDGLYLLSFQAQLSPLQAFSIGVAMLHSREPLMSAKECNIQESCARALNASLAKQVRTLSEEISTPQDDIPRNHDVFSVSCVPDRPLSPFGRV